MARYHGSWSTTCTQAEDGKYIPSRSLPLHRNPIRNLITRLVLAYHVFRGRYDALDWS